MNNAIEKKEGVSLKGVYKFTKAKLITEEHFALNFEIERLRNANLPYRHLIDKLHSICETEVITLENIIPTVGRTMIANNLTDASPDNTMLVNKVALGSGTNTPSNSDTTLQTETYRNAVASLANSNNIAYITGFFSALETSGTYREAGLFVDGTGSADTGVLLSRIAINITKSTSETLTIDWTLTIN